MTTAVFSQNKPQIITVANNSFRILEVKPKQLSLHWKNNNNKSYNRLGKLKSDLESQGKRVMALMNAGIYSKKNEPAGLHIEKGKVLKSLNTKTGYGNFHVKPNGIFYVTTQNNAYITTTSTFKKKFGNKNTGIRLATQSGPMLLINGKISNRLLAHSSSLYSRNGICTTRKGKVFFIATNDDNGTRTNLYHFAKATQKLGCHNALYLDGNISKLYQPQFDGLFHFRHFVGILSVTQ